MGRLQEGNGLRCRKLGEHQEPWGIHAAGATGDAWGLPSDWESNRNRGATRAAAANGAGSTLLGSVEKLGVPAVKVTSEQGWAWASWVDCSRHPQTLDAPVRQRNTLVDIAGRAQEAHRRPGRSD